MRQITDWLMEHDRIERYSTIAIEKEINGG
jgi:hypothetical protein